MREALRDVDANLLLSLHALLEERNLTHAGARLAMSQPAMSGALGRLRKHFGDELLVRAGRDFQLTPMAEDLLPLVATAVESAESLLGAHRAFDAARSSKRFGVSMSEYAMSVVAEPLARAVHAAAPGCTIAVDTVPASPELQEAQLMRRDLVIGPLGFDLPGRRQPVFTDHLVALVDRDNPHVVDGALTLADLVKIPHVVAEFTAAGRHRRPLEVALEENGLGERQVAMTVTSLLTVPFAISGTSMCGFVPSRLARRCVKVLDLQIVSTPLPPVQIVEAAHWHPRREDDPSVRWLRQLLYDVAIELDDEP